MQDNSVPLQAAIERELEAARKSFFSLIERVPLDWQPVIFEANTPYTSYLRVRQSIVAVQQRLHYFDRYLKPDFFSLFLRDVGLNVEIRLVTTTTGASSVTAQSELFRREWKDYQLLQLAPQHFHDRNLRVDKQMFTLGPGIDRAGVSLTNFSPADSSPSGHAALDGLLSMATVIHQS